MNRLDKPIIHFKFPQETLTTSTARAFLNDVMKMFEGKAYVLATVGDMQVVGTEHLNIDIEKCSVSELFKILGQIKDKEDKRKKK